MFDKPIPYGRQYITDDDIEAVVETLRSDYLTQGPRIAEFERKFAEYCGAAAAVAVSNGTAALHLCALALGVRPGDRVITTPITFAASANGFRYCGAEIHFCDIDPRSALIDLDKLEDMLAASPAGTYKGVVAVDYAGYPVDAERLRRIADKHGLWVVEDACHAPGAAFVDSKGERQPCGSGKYVDMTVFSFHPVKHITTGEGGMVTTEDPKLLHKLTLLRSHGIVKGEAWHNEMVELGYNYRITDIQCALGISQLSRADAGVARRREIAARYDEAFAPHPAIRTIIPEAGREHAWHLYVVQVVDRKGLYDHLRENGIYAQVHYVPLHTMQYYRNMATTERSLPASENFYAYCLSLPMYPSLTDEQQEYIIKKVLDYENSRNRS